MYINKLKKLVGIVVSATMIAASLMTAPFAAMAAERNLVNYDFESTGTDLTTDVVVEKGEGRNGDNENTGGAAIDSGALKINVVACNSGTGYNQNYYSVRVKIPYSGLEDDENLKISFDTWDLDDVFDINWQQFGTLVNSNENMVVWGRRDGSTEYRDRWAGFGGTAQMLLAGFKANGSYDTTNAPGSAGYNQGVTAGTLTNDNVGAAGANIDGTTKHTICYDIERETGLVTVTIDGTQTGTFYVLNQLTASGYLDFRGWTYTSNADTQYIDNVKITAYKEDEVYVPDTQLPVNYDFETTGTVIGEENADVISFKGVGKSDVANTGSLSVENGVLKFAPLDGKHNTDVNQNYYQLTASIPYSGLGENESLKISFDTQDPDATFDMMWRHFGTLVNSDGKMVLWSRRDTQTQWAPAPGRWNSGYGGTAQLLFVGMKEKCTTYNTTAIPGSICPATDSEIVWASGGAITNDNCTTTAAFAGANLGTNNVYNVSYIIDRSTDLVTVSLDGNVIGSFYMMNELTSSGTLLFYGCTMANTSEVQYIDNVKIEKYVPSAQIGAVPFTYDFSSNDTTGLEVSYGAGNGNADPNTSSVAVKDGKVEFTVNNTADESVTDGVKLNDLGLGKFNAVLEIPYNGLKDGENLRVSFKYKDNDASFNMKWSDFGSLKNSAGKMVVGSRRDGGTGMNRWGTGFGAVNQLLLVGYKEKLTTYDTAAVPGTNTTGVNFGSLSNSNVGYAGTESSSSAEHTVTYTVNSTTDEVVVTIDGKLAGKFYAMNELTTSGSIVFKAWEFNGSTDTAYIDDISVSAWKPLTVETTNLTAADYDAAADIELTFTNKLGCDASVIKQALTITTADGKVVPPANITVSVAEDGKTAVIDIAGGLRYGKTSYTLTLAEKMIYDESDLYLEDGYTFTLVTKFAKGMYISSVADKTISAANVSLKATITNPTASPAPAWVVVAVYDATNKVIGLDTATVTSVAGNGGTETVTLTTAIDGVADRIQLLMWDSNEELTPYHIPVDVE